ncbi:hypothetical protein D082_11020 [Synechocystis sp. PCC 6714]|nr:hypothetical protein D082_11020 [Synechocystis sp. PCC 6714]
MSEKPAPFCLCYPLDFLPTRPVYGQHVGRNFQPIAPLA